MSHDPLNPFLYNKFSSTMAKKPIWHLCFITILTRKKKINGRSLIVIHKIEKQLA